MGNKSVKNHMINHSVAGKNKEDLIHRVLTDNKFRVVREASIQDEAFNQKYKQRNVDFKFMYGTMNIYLESDGEVHGDLENPSASTIKRNADFNRINLKYVLINHESIKYLLKLMKEDGKMGGISVENMIEFLVTYRAWEEYSKYICTRTEDEI
jgi:hypothetical protein